MCRGIFRSEWTWRIAKAWELLSIEEIAVHRPTSAFSIVQPLAAKLNKWNQTQMMTSTTRCQCSTLLLSWTTKRYWSKGWQTKVTKIGTTEDSLSRKIQSLTSPLGIPRYSQTLLGSKGDLAVLTSSTTQNTRIKPLASRLPKALIWDLAWMTSASRRSKGYSPYQILQPTRMSLFLPDLDN